MWDWEPVFFFPLAPWCIIGIGLDSQRVISQLTALYTWPHMSTAEKKKKGRLIPKRTRLLMVLKASPSLH